MQTCSTHSDCGGDVDKSKFCDVIFCKDCQTVCLHYEKDCNDFCPGWKFGETMTSRQPSANSPMLDEVRGATTSDHWSENQVGVIAGVIGLAVLAVLVGVLVVVLKRRTEARQRAQKTANQQKTRVELTKLRSCKSSATNGAQKHDDNDRDLEMGVQETSLTSGPGDVKPETDVLPSHEPQTQLLLRKHSWCDQMSNEHFPESDRASGNSTQTPARSNETLGFIPLSQEEAAEL